MYNPASQATPEFTLSIPDILPHKNIYTIQVGTKEFKLSGASLSFAGPSYFTTFFQSHPNQTLFIDRSPEVFNTIYQYLQGYSVDITNDFCLIYLLVDLAYYGLQGLTAQLQREYYYVRVGGRSAVVPKVLVDTAGNTPNLFTTYNISYEEFSWNNNNTEMIRPPPIRPIAVDSRSGDLFFDLLEILRGNWVVQNETHRSSLRRECRYYRLMELEQRLVPHRVVPSGPSSGTTPAASAAIVINLGDILPLGVEMSSPVSYSRPHVLKEPKRTLIFQIDDTNGFTVSPLAVVLKGKLVEFLGAVARKLLRVLGLVVENLDVFSLDCDLSQADFQLNRCPADRNSTKRQKVDVVLTKSMWKMTLEPVMLWGVKLEGWSDWGEFNKGMEFL